MNNETSQSGDAPAFGISKADRILEAALDLFIADGFAETPMDAIAEKAGVAKGTLYYHYKSKEGIVDALLERYALRIEETLEPILANMAMDFQDKQKEFSEAIETISRETFSRLHKLRLIDIHQKTMIMALKRVTPFYVRLIEEGAASGRCSADHALEFAEIFVIASQYLLDPEYGTGRRTSRVQAIATLEERAFQFMPGSLSSTYQRFI